MAPRIKIFFIGLIIILNACGKDESLNGSFKLYVSTDTSSAAIGDLIKFRIETESLGDNYLVIPDPPFNEPLELRQLKPIYNEFEGWEDDITKINDFDNSSNNL